MNLAYSLLEVKSLYGATGRSFAGIATTPTPDRMGDVIEPLGLTFKNPVPLLLFHDKEQPVGTVSFGKPTKTGVPFTATIPSVTEPGLVKDVTDQAAHLVKYGLIRGVSVGFRPLDDGIEQIKGTNGLRFTKSELFELSLVPIPANVEATILTVKSFDTKDLAASGLHTPGVTGTSTPRRQDAPAMTIPEQITQFSNLRAVKAARMNDLMNGAAAEGSTLDEAQSQEYDGLVGEVKSIDTHIVRLKDQESLNIANATAITNTTSTVTASDLRGGAPQATRIVMGKSQLPKGTGFTRMVMAIAATRGNKWEAAEYAKRWDSTTPDVSMILKSAVGAGTTTDSTFAAPLAVATPLANEFIELLRPATLVGKIANLRRVPFNISVPTQTAGGTYSWVGQGLPKPLTNMALSTVTLAINKIAGIIVLTEELVRVSSPSAEELVRNEMINGIGAFKDAQFIDPSVAASGTVTPASITNGTTPLTSSGSSNDNAFTDIKALIATFVAANLTTANAVFIMSQANAFALATAVNALGAQLFPGMSVNGGMIFGIPVVTSQSAGTTVALVDAQGILYADDGGVNIDVSREASLQMDSAPTSPPDASTVFVSMFQSNMVALRAELYCTWRRARTASVKYMAATWV